MRATLVEVLRRAALAVVRGTTSARVSSVSRAALRSSSTHARARCDTVSVLARTEIRRSEGPASGASAGHIPASASIERPGGVPITTATSETPASCLACSATRMRSIESKYEFRRTAHIKRIGALRSSPHYSESVNRPRPRLSPQADHHEAPLLELVVDVSPLPLTGAARDLTLGSRRQDAPVEEDLDVRHSGEDPLEVNEQLRAVPSDDDDYSRHRSSSSENLPNRSDGPRPLLERPKDFTAFSNGTANAVHSVS